METETIQLKKIWRPEYAEFEGWGLHAIIDRTLRQLISDPTEMELLEVRPAVIKGKPVVECFLRERIESRLEARVVDSLCHGTLDVLARGLLEGLRSRPFGTAPVYLGWEVQEETEKILTQILSQLVGQSDADRMRGEVERAAVKEYGLGPRELRNYEKFASRSFGLMRFVNHRLRSLIGRKIAEIRRTTDPSRARKVS